MINILELKKVHVLSIRTVVNNYDRCAADRVLSISTDLSNEPVNTERSLFMCLAVLVMFNISKHYLCVCNCS